MDFNSSAEEDGGSEQPTLSTAVDFQTVVIDGKAVPKQRARSKGHGWSKKKKKPKGAPPVIIKPPSPIVDGIEIELSSDEEDNASVRSTDNAQLDGATGSDSSGDEQDLERNRRSEKRHALWARMTAKLFDDEPTRAWFLSLSRDEQIRVSPPRRVRRKAQIHNVDSMRGQDYREMAKTTAVPMRKKDITETDEENADDNEPLPERNKVLQRVDSESLTDAQPRVTDANETHAGKPQPAQTNGAVVARASWRRPRPEEPSSVGPVSAARTPPAPAPVAERDFDAVHKTYQHALQIASLNDERKGKLREAAATLMKSSGPNRRQTNEWKLATVIFAQRVQRILGTELESIELDRIETLKFATEDDEDQLSPPPRVPVLPPMRLPPLPPLLLPPPAPHLLARAPPPPPRKLEPICPRAEQQLVPPPPPPVRPQRQPWETYKEKDPCVQGLSRAHKTRRPSYCRKSYDKAWKRPLAQDKLWAGYVRDFEERSWFAVTGFSKPRER